jgi:hypothetical protein
MKSRLLERFFTSF